ncbi:hypothetical protein [Mesorhizobium sp.]|uniref:hypothetical protein n=1 Tax=Mesorhizobium sp. TaxID=1871066 RepID=UPI000FE8213D|nr:hypothetical protein [Mesorhizobium sp.]RWO92141.1 MAG: hypothetical protein EOQ95_08930 [Mesorhizobium sp.]RWQ54380.1 MAG: hypothetical protein EOS84_13830 [Mesorhizobium sp.]
MHNSVCLDFDGGSSSKARLDTRITKVGQTNIDELLLDFFWRRVNFLLSPSAFVVGGPMALGPVFGIRSAVELPAQPACRQLLKM